uniref:Odorant receptor n=1 Tax=Conogethes pinicolalis TaxID=1178461 RepID=A0A5B9G9Y1_9NEOP|nr:odorant receptor 5 [Conogethes pinicolalis]
MQKGQPLLLTHIRILRLSLMTCGAWPNEILEGSSRRRFILAFIIIIISCLNSCGELNYLIKNYNILPFFDLGDLYMTFFLTILTLIRAIIPTVKSYRDVVCTFFMEFHLEHYKQKGEYYEKICNKINKFSHYFTLLTVANMTLGPIFFNLAPLYNNYRHGAFTNNNREENYTLQFSVYFLYPWYDQEDHFIVTSLINLYLSYFCALLVCCLDLLMSLMAFQIIGHIKTLIYDLRHVPRPNRHIAVDTSFCETNTKTNIYAGIRVYDEQENIVIRAKLIELVNHHRQIVNFAGSMSKLFGPMLAFTYLYQLISCALLLLECSQGDPAALARYGPLTVIIFYQLAQISFTFEFIGSESDKLKDETYDIPWECMSVKNQRLVWMLLNRIQIPIRVTALGMVEVGVQAMVAILKTTFSYFALLKSINE